MIEGLTEEELAKIDDKVIAETVSIWDEGSLCGPLLWTYCSRCPGNLRDRIKTRCIGRIDTMEALCARCWAKERERKLIEEAVKAKQPKLDAEDFARL